MTDDLILGSVYSPTESMGGYTQSVLNTLWWKNFLELAYADNTLFWDDSNIGDNPYNTDEDLGNDVTLTDLAQKNQLDNIQFLAGVFNETGTATRTITVDAQADIFFPILNTVWIPEPGEPAYPAGNTPEIINSLNDDMDGVTSLVASIDGIEIPDLFTYRQYPGDEFSFKTGGLITDPNYPVLGPTYSSGYYVGLSALPPELEGHTIHFEGSLPNFELNVTYNIDYDFNEVRGTNGKDRNLRGTAKSDKIQGFNGTDTLIGMEGNDNLNGGNGPDTLIGVNPSVSAPGFGEIDVLRGGNGPDTFVLGDHHKVYYLGENLRDYALLKDIEGEDTIQLMAQDYSFAEGTLLGKSGTAISLDGDLIAFVEGITGLTQTSPQVSFV